MTGRHMRLAPALALALVPFAAGAVSLLVNNSTAGVLVGESNCKTLQLVANWDLGTTPSTGESVRLLGARDPASCTTNPPSPSAQLTRSETLAQTGADTVSANQMAFTDGGTVGCDDPAIADASSANPLTNVLCVQYLALGGLSTASVNVSYALAKPTPPQDLSYTAGDRHFRVNWSPGDAAETIATYDVHVVLAGTTSTGGTANTVSAKTNADIEHTDDGTALQNDAGYTVRVVAHDTYGNVSDPSDSITATPVPSSDFYEHYREEGGSALGGHGCTTGGASAWIAGGALAMALLLRRRRKARNGAALIALFALVAPSARAEERPSPRFLVGFKMDRYDPKVDSEPGLTGTPYHDVFGPRAPPRYQLEFDWEVAHPFGSLLIGATAGFWQNYGKAILVSSTPGTAQQSQDTTTLNVFPFGLIATYRFDWLADRWERFPFIPYAQAGLMRALWVTYDGRGDVSKPQQGGRGSGWTSGYTTALGVAVNLNALDPTLAREAYVDTGIQRTALFAEYGWTYLSNFNKRGALILSDHAWRFGVSVEF
jgi:MYXO-CTERM domain-containing protein